MAEICTYATDPCCLSASHRLVQCRTARAAVRSGMLWASIWSVATCSTSLATPLFTDVTTAAGITHTHAISSASNDAMTGGAAAGDFDGDGLIDLFFTRPGATDVLYRNTGTAFEDISTAAGFTATVPSAGVTSGDVDNDGDLDLYVSTTSHNRFYLYINDGAAHFTEQALLRGAAVEAPGTSTWRSMGTTFGDYDRDGYLDILTTDHSRPMSNNGSRLLHNLGAANPGHFEDVTHAAGLDVYRQALNLPNTVYRFQPQFADMDGDGRTDILFSSDDRTSQLFWNNGDGTFIDGTLAAGVGTDKSGMGSAVADYDGDGDLDWFITAIFDTPFLGVNPGNRLYRNNGNRTFTDVTTAAGVRNSGAGQEVSWGWGTAFLDYDNDGDQDLAMTNGWVALGYGGDDTTLRRNNGNGTFTDVTVGSGIVDTGQGRGLLRLDYDVDGDLDMLIVTLNGAPILYRNDTGDSGSWLRVKTIGAVSNRNGIGAIVTVTPDAYLPEATQMWEIHNGESFLSQSEMTAHFGLGARTSPVDLVTIRWPSGIVQRFFDVAPNSVLIADEAMTGDFNADLLVDVEDLATWHEEFGQLASDRSADADLDGDVDGRDFLIWQRLLSPPASALDSARLVPEPSTYALLMIVLGSRLLRNVSSCLTSSPLRRRACF